MKRCPGNRAMGREGLLVQCSPSRCDRFLLSASGWKLWARLETPAAQTSTCGFSFHGGRRAWGEAKARGSYQDPRPPRSLLRCHGPLGPDHSLSHLQGREQLAHSNDPPRATRLPILNISQVTASRLREGNVQVWKEKGKGTSGPPPRTASSRNSV